MNFNDPNNLTAIAIVFNENKFYAGRAIYIAGIYSEGEYIEGTFLIQKVNMDRLVAVDSNGKEFELVVDYFVDEIEGEEVYPAAMMVEFFGADRG